MYRTFNACPEYNEKYVLQLVEVAMLLLQAIELQPIQLTSIHSGITKNSYTNLLYDHYVIFNAYIQKHNMRLLIKYRHQEDRVMIYFHCTCSRMQTVHCYRDYASISKLIDAFHTHACRR